MREDRRERGTVGRLRGRRLSRARAGVEGEIASPNPGPADRPDDVAIDPRRYRKLRRFIFRVLLHAAWWEIFLNQPLLRRFRRPWIPRYTRIARAYRALAIEMGGVLIKLGQFLSARVDVLPREITQVLAELQDEVPPAPFEKIVREIEADLGAPVDSVFRSVDPEVLGAASLAQVHGARLAEGGEVVVKVLRPGIEVLVETDVAALGFAVRWLQLWKPIRRRVNLHRLVREFTYTTRRELDMQIEGHSAERFAENFKDDPGIRAPEIYWEQSGHRVLTMEDVSFIKIYDHPGLEAAGVDRSELAARVYRAYLEQIFAHNFVHADPHPGNIFVRPLDPGGAEPAQESDAPETEPEPEPRGHPFQLVFVDFGMMAEVPERLRQALREIVVGFAARDARRVVKAAQDVGMLLPGADVERLVAVHEDVFDRFWGIRVGEMRDVAMSQARYFLREYWDLIADLPFQVQTDLLFVARAMGLLGGLATSLDPDFDPWAETLPFAAGLARGELEAGGGLWETVADQARLLLRLPGQASRFYSQAARGELKVEAELAPEAGEALRRLERSVGRLAWFVASTGLLVSGVALELGRPERWWGLALIGVAGVGYLWGLVRKA